MTGSLSIVILMKFQVAFRYGFYKETCVGSTVQWRQYSARAVGHILKSMHPCQKCKI